MAAAAHWATLFPSKQKILSCHFCASYKQFLKGVYPLQAAALLLKYLFWWDNSLPSVFCVDVLDSPRPLFIVISVIPPSFPLV